MHKRGVKIMALVLAAGIGFAQAPAAVLAEKTSSDAQKRIEELEGQKTQVQNEINDLSAEQQAAQQKIDELDEQLETVRAEISEKDTEIADKQMQINDTQVKLDAAIEDENVQFTALKHRIKTMYENGNVSYLEIIASAQDISVLLNSQEYISKISDYDNLLLENLQKTREAIAAYEQQLNDEKAELEIIKAELEDKEAELDTLAQQKAAELEIINADLANAENDLHRLDSDIESEQKELEQLKAAEAEAERQYQLWLQSQQQSAAGGGGGNSGNFQPSSGLRWPLSGYSGISSYFGSRICPFHGPEFHNGIDIPAASGTPVHAAANGVVVTAAYDSSLGNYIVINHNNGLKTYYLHNSSLAVSVGQTVSQGQTISYVGSTGSSTGAHLDFRVARNGAFVNPLAYVSP